MRNKIKNKIINECDFKKICNYFELKRDSNNTLDILMESLETKGDIIVIGGAIRDIIINKCEPRDIDLIIDTEESLEDIMVQFKNVSRNRFGGYKVKSEDLEIDVWSIVNHWAFKERIIEKSFENLKHSTFLNFDSAIYNLTSNVANVDIFNEAILNSCLDITLQDEYIYTNPTISTNIIRMFIIKNEWDLNFSEKVDKYILSWILDRENPVQELWNAQIKHYKNTMISWNSIDKELANYKARV